MKLRIEPLNHSHIAEVMNIENDVHVSPWSERIVSQSFGPRSHNAGLFKVEGSQYQLIGYYFSGYVAGEVSLENISIAKEFQGKGLSKKLMADLELFSKEQDAEEIWLEVRSSNRPAIALYESMGFESAGIRKAYYSIPGSNEKEDAIAMLKRLC